MARNAAQSRISARPAPMPMGQNVTGIEGRRCNFLKYRIEFNTLGHCLRHSDTDRKNTSAWLAFCALREHIVAVRQRELSPMPSLGVSSLDLGRLCITSGLFFCPAQRLRGCQAASCGAPPANRSQNIIGEMPGSRAVARRLLHPADRARRWTRNSNPYHRLISKRWKEPAIKSGCAENILPPLVFCAVREHIVAVRQRELSPMPSLGVSSQDLGRLRIASGLFFVYSAAARRLPSPDRANAASAPIICDRSCATVANPAEICIVLSSM